MNQPKKERFKTSVGGQALSEFVKVRHAVPLESLQDVFSYDELRDFDAHVREEEPDAEYSVEPKVDGLSVALEYLDGVFTRGATRGDGLVGVLGVCVPEEGFQPVKRHVFLLLSYDGWMFVSRCPFYPASPGTAAPVLLSAGPAVYAFKNALKTPATGALKGIVKGTHGWVPIYHI